MMKSYLTHLECSYCGERADAHTAQRTCPHCGKVLLARYDLKAAARALSPRELQERPTTMWRYFEVLPVQDPDSVVSLGEGFTPLLPAPHLGRVLGCTNLYIKDEGLNPTATFKARGLSVAVSRARELGKGKLSIPSAGNAAGALAAYCACGGLEAHVFMPRDTPESNKKECTAYGARLTLVDGLIGDAGRLSRERAAQEGLFDVSTLQEPYRAEGKKTMGYEIVEQLGWRYPDAIIYPTGGGTGIVGMWKAFQEMEELGWVQGTRPKLVCVQPEGCAPIVCAFHQGERFARPWEGTSTVAAGLRVPSAIGDYLVLQALRESGGTAVAVPDEEMVACMKEMAAYEGVFPAPEGAATLAGLKHLLRDRFLDPEETIVLLNTGSGLKYLELVEG